MPCRYNAHLPDSLDGMTFTVLSEALCINRLLFLTFFTLCISGCVAQYFKGGADTVEIDEESRKKMQGYKCVLNSQATGGSGN